MTTVAKEFKTYNRRFKIGDPVSESDVALSDLDWAHLKVKGFVVDVAKVVEKKTKFQF